MATHRKYYYFTSQLKHNNSNKVKFPAINSYPFSANDNSEYLTISLNGDYHIIYRDYYRKSAHFNKRYSNFIIHDQANGNDVFDTHLYNELDWTLVTINADIPITVDSDLNYAKIKMYIESNENPLLGGVDKSTFYIKYLNLGSVTLTKII